MHMLFFIAGERCRQRVQDAIDKVLAVQPQPSRDQAKVLLRNELGPAFVDRVWEWATLGVTLQHTYAHLEKMVSSGFKKNEAEKRRREAAAAAAQAAAEQQQRLLATVGMAGDVAWARAAAQAAAQAAAAAEAERQGAARALPPWLSSVHQQRQQQQQQHQAAAYAGGGGGGAGAYYGGDDGHLELDIDPPPEDEDADFLGACVWMHACEKQTLGRLTHHLCITKKPQRWTRRRS
jgi:hypothetical protein